MSRQTHKMNDEVLRALVINQFPQAQLAFEIANALQKYLPFTSVEQVQRAIENMTLGGFQLDVGTVQRFASKELLPIKDPKDLIHKIVGLLNVALHQANQGNPLPSETARFVAELGRVPGSRKSSIPTVHFVGPSIYGCTPAKGA